MENTKKFDSWKIQPSGLQLKPSDEPVEAITCDCTEGKHGVAPFWFEPETHSAVGVCCNCGARYRIKLHQPGEVIRKSK